MTKDTVFIFLLCLLVISAGCMTITKKLNSKIISEKKEDTPTIPDIEQCRESYVNNFFSKTFGVDTSSYKIKSCGYKRLGYGGSYNYNLSVGGNTHASIYYSGMGSGGHAYTSYCFQSFNHTLVESAQKKLCEGMRYVEETYTKNGCVVKFNATSEIIQACKGGLFTFPANLGSVISYTKEIGVYGCGDYINFYDIAFDCTKAQKIDTSQAKQKLKEIIKKFKS